MIIASFFEAPFAFCLGKAKTSSDVVLDFIIILNINMVLLIKTTQSLSIGTAYVVWTDIGVVGAVLTGIILK